MIGKKVGSYEIKGLIGESPGSIVYRATQPSLGRPVAVMMLKLAQASDPAVRERFRLEALKLSKLNHPNIVVIYDFIRQYGSFFIIMELLRGRPLGDVIEQKGAIPPDKLVPMFTQMLEAIRYAHRKEILHGDIRPSNVFVDEQGTVKITDFGKSRIAASATVDSRSSIQERVKYISPEGIKREPYDERSEVYSLGCLLYKMATGRSPFSGKSAYEIMEHHIRETPVPPREVAPDVPKIVADTIEKAMQKSPDKRFQSLKEMEAFFKGDTTHAEVARLNKQAFKLYGHRNYPSAMGIWEQVLKLDPGNAKALGGLARVREKIGTEPEEGLFEIAAKPSKQEKAGRGEPGGSKRTARPTTIGGAVAVLARAISSPRKLNREPALMFLIFIMLGVVLLAGFLIINITKSPSGRGITLAVPVPNEFSEPKPIASVPVKARSRDVRRDREDLALDASRRAKKLCENGQRRKALVMYQKALDLSEHDSREVARDYASCCVLLGLDLMKTAPDTALQFFQKASKIDPSSSEAHLQIGRVLGSRRDYQRAIASYQKALSIDPDLALARFNLGHAYMSLKKFSKATKEFSAVVASDSALICDAYVNLGVAYYRMGNLKKAADVFSKGVSACPKNRDLRTKRDSVMKKLKNAPKRKR
ncbi:protein kinase [bacterium]|nr:protein kinase [bacterium]